MSVIKKAWKNLAIAVVLQAYKDALFYEFKETGVTLEDVYDARECLDGEEPYFRKLVEMSDADNDCRVILMKKGIMVTGTGMIYYTKGNKYKKLLPYGRELRGITYKAMGEDTWNLKQ